MYPTWRDRREVLESYCVLEKAMLAAFEKHLWAEPVAIVHPAPSSLERKAQAAWLLTWLLSVLLDAY